MKIFKQIFLIILIKFSLCNQNIHGQELDKIIDTKLINPISSEEKITQIYLNDIKSQADFTKNPCDNFQAFACGHLHNKDKIGYRFNIKDEFYIQDILLKEPQKSEAEQRAKDFYLSCISERDIKQIFEQVPTLKSIAKWPTNKSFNNTEVAELMAELASIVEMFLIKIQIKQNQIFLEGVQPLGLENMDNIIKQMEDFGTSPEESQAAVKDISEFLKNVENLFRYFSPETITDVQFQNRNILQRKIPNFNWNAYLMKYFSSLNLKLDSLNFDIRTKNLELLEKVIELIEKTDRKTIVNFLIYKYIQFGTKHKCEEFLAIFRPIIVLRLWQKYMNNDDENRHLELLNNFQKSYNEIKEIRLKLLSIESERIIQKIQNRKNIIVNHTKILNNDIIQKHYELFDVVPNAIFLNQINFYHTFARDYILYGDNGKFSQLYYAFLEGLGGEVDIMAHNKPLLYYFVSENVELWRNVFEELKPWNKQQLHHQQQRELCSKEGFFDETYKIDYASNKQSYLDYLKWLEGDDGVGLDDDAEYIDGFVNQKRAYFMALAQYQCFDKGMQNNMNNNHKTNKGGDVFVFLSRFKDFSTEYGCKPGDKMHKWNFNCKIW